MNNSIATIAYHHVGTIPTLPEQARYAVSLEVFESHMQWLSESHFTTVSLDDATEQSESGFARLVITFDDGFESDHRFALPILRKLGLPAVFFVSPGNIGTPGYLSWKQLGELASEGMAIGTHGYDHTLFDQLPPEKLEEQLRRSRDELQDYLATAVRSVSLPGGIGGDRAARTARSLGYDRIFGSCPKFGTPDEWLSGVIPRIALRDHHDLDDLVRLLESPLQRTKLVARYRTLRAIRSSLGRDRLEAIIQTGSALTGKLQSVITRNR